MVTFRFNFSNAVAISKIAHIIAQILSYAQDANAVSIRIGPGQVMPD